jgi:hypothetical protein
MFLFTLQFPQFRSLIVNFSVIRNHILQICRIPRMCNQSYHMEEFCHYYKIATHLVDNYHLLGSWPILLHTFFFTITFHAFIRACPESITIWNTRSCERNSFNILFISHINTRSIYAIILFKPFYTTIKYNRVLFTCDIYGNKR